MTADRPWLKRYAPTVPPTVGPIPGGLHLLLPGAAAEFLSRPAVVLAVGAAGRVFSSTLTYAQVESLAARFAASLVRLGVARGDRVALYLPNCPQFVVAYHALLRVGAIAVPVNPLYSPRELMHQLRDSGASVCVALDRFLPQLHEVRGRTGLRRVIVASLKEHFPPVLWALYTLTAERKQPRARLGPDDLPFRSLLRPPAPPPAAPAEISLDDTAVLLYTGGTTGVSKGAELSHRNLLTNAEQNRAWAGIGRGAKNPLAALPLFHAFGLTCCLNLGTLTASTLVLVPNPTDVASLARIVHRHRPTLFPVVPTLLVGIANLPDLPRHDLTSVRVMPCAGSPLAPAVQRTFHQRTGVMPVEGYGLTEASPTVMGNPPGDGNRPGTVGLPYPDTLAKVVDPDTGADLPLEGEWTPCGEIVVKGPQVMKGYWNRPDETAAQMRDGWLRTGDLGQMHRDGYFRVVDRLKDLIIRGGMKVYPAEVEAVLAEHPGVREALVIGVPDEARGELVEAFVVPAAGASLREGELLEHCRRNLARYKVPAAITIRAELPRSAVGKPLRRLLRQEVLG